MKRIGHVYINILEHGCDIDIQASVTDTALALSYLMRKDPSFQQAVNLALNIRSFN